VPTHLHEPLIIAVGLARALELLALGAIFVVGMIAAACVPDVNYVSPFNDNYTSPLGWRAATSSAGASAPRLSS